MQTEKLTYRGRTLTLKETTDRGWWWSHRQNCGFAPTRNEALAAAVTWGDTPKPIASALLIEGKWEPGNFLPTVDMPTVIVSRKIGLTEGRQIVPGYIAGILHPYGTYDSDLQLVNVRRVQAEERWDSEAINRMGNPGAVVSVRPALLDEIVAKLIAECLVMREEFE